MSNPSSAPLSHSPDANLEAPNLNEQAMTEAPEKSLLEVTLSGAIALAKNGKNYDQAKGQFDALLAQINSESPMASKLLKQLWQEYLSVQRSARFYESLSEAEAGLSEKMAKSTLQIKQNYMRLIQEQ
ncbi:MAG: hypothetical protein HC800_00775 [Phormidesmis sp. RL_2_1]|nr:hypothetical protein [Phormidesmis sp. RL_2_1]